MRRVVAKLDVSIGRLGQVPESEKVGAQDALRVGVIGLGDMGGGLATSLIRAGMPVTVSDLREEATAPFREGAHVAATPAELAGRSDVVLVVVFNDAQVRAVLQGPDGVFAGAAPGTTAVIVEHHPHRHGAGDARRGRRPTASRWSTAA